MDNSRIKLLMVGDIDSGKTEMLSTYPIKSINVDTLNLNIIKTTTNQGSLRMLSESSNLMVAVINYCSGNIEVLYIFRDTAG
jgi:hypothetical protein